MSQVMIQGVSLNPATLFASNNGNNIKILLEVTADAM